MDKVAQTSPKYLGTFSYQDQSNVPYHAYLSSIPIPAQKSPAPQPNFLLRELQILAIRERAHQERGRQDPISRRRIHSSHVTPSAFSPPFDPSEPYLLPVGTNITLRLSAQSTDRHTSFFRIIDRLNSIRDNTNSRQNLSNWSQIFPTHTHPSTPVTQTTSPP